MTRQPKPRKCKVCKELFTPRRINLVLDKVCRGACELTYAEMTASKVKVKPKKIVKVKPKKKPKQKTAAKLKTELWPIFSLHQKLVHSLDGKWCQCYTCDKPLEIGTANCHGGHCLSKAVYKNLYFDERAVRPQCYYCNVNLGGMHYDFCEKLKQEIGVEEFNAMKRHGKDVVKRDRLWYLEQIEYYTAQNELLKRLKS